MRNSSGGGDTIELSVLSASVTFDLNAGTNVLGLLTINLNNLSGAAAPQNYENVIGSAVASNVLSGNGADNILVGGSQSDTLSGDEGHDILIGNDGGDTLSGNTGRGILIGGFGLDILTGGEDEDILISGLTIYDGLRSPVPSAESSPYPALAAIRLSWLSSTKEYEERIDELMSGLGESSDSDDLVRLVEGATVFGDLRAETLDGGSGRDWFFAGFFDTALPDPDEPDERVD